ncbi:MAG: hypothetical protein OEZ59_11800 [Deltaproteobacteria bacterium]|nr:hypothetical protein [Deltaproteobacteria bacterium]
MGKSVTPYSQVIDRLEHAFADFRRGLPRPDQQRLDRLFNEARRHTAPGVLLSDPDPFRPVMLAMLIELLRRLEELEDDRTHLRGGNPF